MQMRPLGDTGFAIAPLVFGGNVLGWTADAATSFRLLDGFTDAGFNAIDTADVYSSWAPGHRGGKSETVIGDWLAARPGRRNQVVVITKVGSEMGPGQAGLSERHILAAADASLKRLRVDAIDVYLAHWPNPATPVAETLGAFGKLLDAGKVRAIGASNLDARQLAEALKVAETDGLPRYQVLQPLYNLAERDKLEGPLLELCRAEGLAVITYFALARGFLTGKYRSQDDLGKSPRGGGIAQYLTPRGFAILGALDVVAMRTNATPAEVALAWVMGKPGVTAPIASATGVAQLEALTGASRLALSAEDVATLDAAGA